MGWNKTVMCYRSLYFFYLLLFSLLHKHIQNTISPFNSEKTMKEACLCKQFRGLFSGTCICVSVCEYWFSNLSLKHKGTRPKALGLDVQFNLHSLTIFIPR